MKDILRPALRLFIITAVAALLLAGTYLITAAPIAEQEKAAAEAARAEVLPADMYTQLDMANIADDEEFAGITEVYTAYDADGNFIGATIGVTAKGFNPGIMMTVGINADSVVTGISITGHEETPGLGAKILNDEFKTQYTGKAADGSLAVIKSGTPADNEIQSISGATKSSKGVTDGVNLAARCFNEFVLPALAE